MKAALLILTIASMLTLTSCNKSCPLCKQKGPEGAVEQPSVEAPTPSAPVEAPEPDVPAETPQAE